MEVSVERFKSSWRLLAQQPEILALRAPGPDGTVEDTLRDNLILGLKRGSTVNTANSTNVYDLIGCAACQDDVLREANKAKDEGKNAKGIIARGVVLKRTEESWASCNVRCQLDKLGPHEKSGLHRFCYPRLARSKGQSD